MNIRDAAQQIQGAVEAYLSLDAHGLPLIPQRMQRPIIMLGPPGVGKTAIVEQIAEEMGINFVSYSITHHTRQSALGLPFIAEEQFGERSYSVSEYTMSEIIAAVYRSREESGVKEGILFLDEVNCVSETLAPAMLQFLQYKTFGMHRLPDGWVIVCAGNPPEYNRAAREFDPAMLDRLMKINVEPDLQVWQDYAASHGAHPAVTTYLDAKPQHFYNVRAAARGSKIVTSRGWEDLSRMLQAYETIGRTVPLSLPERYLQDTEIAEDFGAYYELFRSYEGDYRVTDILAGAFDPLIVDRAANAPFDERVAMVGMLVDAMCARAHDCVELGEALKLAREDVVAMREALDGADSPVEVVRKRIGEVEVESHVRKRPEGQVGDRSVIRAERLRVLADIRLAVAQASSAGEKPYDAARDAYNSELRKQAAMAQEATAALDNSFTFLDDAFGEDAQEPLIYITKLSADPVVIHLVSEHGSEQFLRHNKNLLFSERSQGLLEQVMVLQEGNSGQS